MAATGVEYTRASEHDVEGIQAVAAESWRQTYRGIFSPEYISTFVERWYSRPGLLRSVQDTNSIFLVAKDAGQVVGFCHFGRGPGGPELFRMYLKPSYWRRGIGTHLLDLLESQLRALSVTRYHCYVHGRNEVGKSFYLKRGFTHHVEGDRDGEWYMLKEVSTEAAYASI